MATDETSDGMYINLHQQRNAGSGHTGRNYLIEDVDLIISHMIACDRKWLAVTLYRAVIV